ncbi:MAG: SDR family NAD(P)-dependent oxidoreductase [Streptomyces sp.]
MHQPLSRPLSDRVCLVTGGAGGIGWALTQALAQRGAYVEVADHAQHHLDRAAKDIAGSPLEDRITLTRLDVRDRHSLEQWISGIHAAHHRIDVLVHNAAFIRWADVADMSVEDQEASMRVGYDALVHTVKAVLPLMRRSAHGHIVAMGSSVGRVYVRGPSAAYCATKAAIEAYTEILRLELSGSGIDVTLVRPAAVTGTDFFATHVDSTRMPRIADFLPPTTPAKVATAITRAITHRQRVVDIPRYLPWIYHAYALAPQLTQTLMGIGGAGHRDYALQAPKQHARAARRKGRA